MTTLVVRIMQIHFLSRKVVLQKGKQTKKKPAGMWYML
jgi:hypothetical protein